MWENDGVPIVITMSSAWAASAARSRQLEAPGVGDTLEQLLGPGFGERHPPVSDRVEQGGIVIDPEHTHPTIGEASARAATRRARGR